MSKWIIISWVLRPRLTEDNPVQREAWKQKSKQITNNDHKNVGNSNKRDKTNMEKSKKIPGFSSNIEFHFIFQNFPMARKCVDNIPGKKIKACSWELENIHKIHLGIEAWAGVSQFICKEKEERKKRGRFLKCAFLTLGVGLRFCQRLERRLGANSIARSHLE